MTRVTVVGAGTMGHALALVFALGGHTVRLTDTNADTLKAAPARMNGALKTLQAGGEVDSSWTEARLAAAVTCHSALADALTGAELVVEAVIEIPDVKRRAYADIAAAAPKDAILASNTSSLDIFPLVPTAILNRTMIAHWYTPPYLVDLVDVVPSATLDPAKLEWVRKLLVAMGKVPVVARKFIKGYITNRIQDAILRESLWLMDEGYATAEEIDDSVIHGLALRMPVIGALAKTDFAGLDLLQQILSQHTYHPPLKRPGSDTLDALVAKGHVGVKAKRGFFDWSRRSQAEIAEDRDRRLMIVKQAMKKAGVLRG